LAVTWAKRAVTAVAAVIGTVHRVFMPAHRPPQRTNRPALVGAQASLLHTHLAMRQIRDDSFAHARHRVIQPVEPQFPHYFGEDGQTGHDNLRAPRPDAGNLGAGCRISRTHLAE